MVTLNIVCAGCGVDESFGQERIDGAELMAQIKASGWHTDCVSDLCSECAGVAEGAELLEFAPPDIRNEPNYNKSG